MKEKRDITSAELKINNLELVWHSFMKYGHIDSPLSGRHSDCFAYILSGEAIYNFNNKEFSVQPGNILYLPYQSVYSFDIITPVYEVLYVDFNFAQDENFNNIPALFHVAKSLNVENSFRKLHKKWLMRRFGSLTECFSLLYEIYAKILKNYSSYIPSNKYNLLENAMDFILSNYTSNNLSIQEIVAHTNLSEGHFRRLFKEVYHVSPIDYITNLKIEHAKDLLLNTKQNLTDIAEFSGFSSAAYFCLLFKKKVGYTPNEFRNRHHS